MMSIPSHQLDAFYKVAQTLSFSKAARELLIGQPALSQRVAALEESLQTTLFERSASMVRLTEAGQRLLRYCEKRASLEAEVIDQLVSTDDHLKGRIRIAGSSTVLGAVGVAALEGFLKKHPRIQPEFLVKQLSELPDLLVRGKADFVILDRVINREGVESVFIGHEVYAVFESPRIQGDLTEVYYDTFEEDYLTKNFFSYHKGQGEKVPAKFRRDFTGDVNVMMDLVERGLGRAVLPIHLVHGNRKIRRCDKFKRLYKEPLYLCFWHTEFPSQLFKILKEELLRESKDILIESI
ncbi:MAG: hypothetical protein C5B49_11680 [Bdellovibrio sp.]|nr:MAG: hypothetical protein C5B49_11680 [Bdellovibrio sp.]